jgi:hypothetical protein
MKKAHTILLSLLAAALFLSVSSARAASPTLSLANVGGNSVQVSITGDSNASISFYYNASTGSQFGIQNFIFGTTSSNGTFSGLVNGATYGINPGSTVYAIVNGQQSTMLTWPYVGSLSPSLSQTNVTVTMGQSVTVTSYGSSNPVYVSNNSNQGVASFSVSGSQITITGVVNGATSMQICYQNSAANCATLFVTVLQSGNNNQLTFSQSYVTLGVGQSVPVSIYGGSGGYFISNNTNPGAVQAVIYGSTITVTAANYSGGISAIAICSSAGGYCGTLTVSTGAGSGGVHGFV